MIVLKYILKSFGRHKARTAIMVLALLVVTVMLVLLNNSIESFQNQIVELVERETGEHDITITRSEFSPSQWIDVGRMTTILGQVDPAIETVYPRFHATVEIQGGNEIGNASLLARTPEDDLGQVKIVDGEYRLDDEHVVILKVTADTFGLAVGDEVDLSYILPRARPKGHETPQNASVGRVARRFTISGIALATGLGGASQNGILADTGTVQDWLNLPGRAERLVLVLDESVYKSLNTQAAIFRVRHIAEKIYDALGSEVEMYTFAIDKAEGLEDSDVIFAVLRSLGAVYGLMVMGVVGLLVYSIFNTNVEERRRDLAFLRIIGAKRSHLFGLVIVEVAVLGLIGVGLGILIGQTLSGTVVSPIASTLISQAASGQEIGIQFEMSVTSAAMVRAAIIAAIVLLLAAIAPARKAAKTKVRYAINPGSADSLQIEDLAKLRTRKFDFRILVAGFVLTVMWLLIFVGINYLSMQNNESIISTFLFTGLALLVIGVSLLFYALTVPFERILIYLGNFVAPKLAFFAGPNLMRAKHRNTIISLMVVFSATLPTFFGTMAALEQKNFDTNARFSNGAPVVARISRWGWYMFAQKDEENLSPDVLDDVQAISGIKRTVGLTKEYQAEASNKVALREVGLQMRGLTGSLDGIVYEDLTEYGPGSGPEIFDRVLNEPDTIILSAGYADYMDLQVGDVIRVPGEGKDHVVDMRVVGLLEKLPGFREISRDENYVRWGLSPGIVSLDTFIRLTNDPVQSVVCPRGVCSPMERDQAIVTQIMASTTETADDEAVVADLRKRFADRDDVWVESTAEEIRTTEQSMRTMRILMLVMTVLSFITCIFGVFAVVYVAVYVRRLEIGMLKAIGMRRRHLVGTFALESVMMTVSASLAGVTAGTILGYVFYVSNNMMSQTPTRLTFDWITTLAILVMVILSSVISAVLAARGVVRSKVTRILREAL